MTSRATLQDIANHCGFSKSMVAQVMRNPQGCSAKQKTKSLIIDTAQKLNYQINYAAKALRSNKTYSIGVLTPHPRYQFLANLISNLHHLLAQTNYIGTFSFWDDPKEIKQATDNILSRNVDGIITIEPDYLPKNLTIPVVSYHNQVPEYDSVVYDTNGYAVQALDYLCSLGHSRIAIIGSQKRLGDLKSEMLKRDLQFNDDWFYNDVINNQDIKLNAYNALKKLFSLKHKPTAIIAHNDSVAFALLRSAKDLGIDVPGQLSIIGFDNTDDSEYSIPRLTTFSKEEEPVAQILFNLLFARMKDMDKPVIHHITKTSLIIRESTAKAPK